MCLFFCRIFPFFSTNGDFFSLLYLESAVSEGELYIYYPRTRMCNWILRQSVGDCVAFAVVAAYDGGILWIVFQQLSTSWNKRIIKAFFMA